MVDAALRFRPPVSTEQVLHPDAYLKVEQPRRVSVRGPVAGAGTRAGGSRCARRSANGRPRSCSRAPAGPRPRGAAAGWGGDRYALLRRGDERALVMRWTWDSARDRAEFAQALRDWGREGLPESTPAGRDAWRTPEGAAALAVRDGAVTLVLAPEPALARRAARAD